MAKPAPRVRAPCVLVGVRPAMPPVSPGDIVLRGNRHVLVVALGARAAFVVPVIFDRDMVHRADVVVPDQAGAIFARGFGTFRCADAEWRRLPLGPRCGRVGSDTMRAISVALDRERQARRVEELPPGIVRSVLGRGPRVGDCGRKVGGSPSD